jgi:hypothetical protein
LFALIACASLSRLSLRPCNPTTPEKTGEEQVRLRKPSVGQEHCDLVIGCRRLSAFENFAKLGFGDVSVLTCHAPARAPALQKERMGCIEAAITGEDERCARLQPRRDPGKDLLLTQVRKNYGCEAIPQVTVIPRERDGARQNTGRNTALRPIDSK